MLIYDIDFTFQESSTSGVPFCYFVDDLYSVSNVQYNSQGATADISLKSSLYANNFPSTPVNPLHLQVTFHKNEMLQFKVNTVCVLGTGKALFNSFPFFKFLTFKNWCIVILHHDEVQDDRGMHAHSTR